MRLIEDFARDLKRGHRRWPARIESEVRNSANNFVARDSVLERLVQVEGQLVHAV